MNVLNLEQMFNFDMLIKWVDGRLRGYVLRSLLGLLCSLRATWMYCTCCDTADSILSSRRLNSSKQPQAPT